MTSTLPICEKLRADRATPYCTVEGDSIRELVNPDGPEAADLLDLLTEALERARAMLEVVRPDLTLASITEGDIEAVRECVDAVLAKVRQQLNKEGASYD